MKKYLVEFIEAASLTILFAVAADLLGSILPTLSWTFFAATCVGFTFSTAAFLDLTDYLDEIRAKSGDTAD